MRINATSPSSILKYLHVYFNGEKHGWVKEADTKEGWIVVYTLTQDGQLNKDKNGEFITMKLSGKVEIKLVDEE